MAQSLGIIIRDKKDLRSSVMSALRKLIQKSIENNNSEDIEALSWFSKNFLPLLFNLYVTQPKGSDEEGQRLACFETIKVCVLKLFDKPICF